jgi:acyl-CoA synthetase (AMP-forming)/AMP-acid ligase II
MTVRTNDLARWSPQAELDLLGRSNQLLKYRGEWIDASPLQRALEEQPGVQRCQLFCDPDGLSAWLAMEQPSRSALRSIAGAVARSEALRASKRFGRTIWRRWSGYHRRSRVETKMHCVKLLGQRLMARDFDRQVAEFQVRVAVLNGFTALGIPVTKVAG